MEWIDISLPIHSPAYLQHIEYVAMESTYLDLLDGLSWSIRRRVFLDKNGPDAYPTNPILDEKYGQVSIEGVVQQ